MRRTVHRDYTSHRSYESAEERSTENDIEKSKTNKTQDGSETAGLGKLKVSPLTRVTIPRLTWKVMIVDAAIAVA